MSATMQFVIGAAILTAAALTLMLWPLWRTARTTGKIDRQQFHRQVLIADRTQEAVDRTDQIAALGNDKMDLHSRRCAHIVNSENVARVNHGES